jgi:hypothetical protein
MRYKNTLDHNLQFSPYILKPGEIFDDTVVPKTKKKIWKAITSLTNSGILKMVTDSDAVTPIDTINATPTPGGTTMEHSFDSGADTNVTDVVDATELPAENGVPQVDGGATSDNVDNDPVKKRGRKAVVR